MPDVTNTESPPAPAAPKLLSGSGGKAATLGTRRSGVAREPGEPWAADGSRSGQHCVPAEFPSAPHKAVWMAGKGCVKQAKHLLAELE